METTALLWKTRLVSLFYQTLSLAGIALLGVFVSDDFRNLVVSNYGDSAFTSLLFLILPEMVKHIRNKMVVKDIPVGSSVKDQPDITLI